MRVGVVGCGYWGSKHVRVMSDLPLVSEVVLIDGRPEIRYAVGQDFPRALQRASIAEAMDNVDAVVIATPPESHLDVALEAIEGGKHVLVEKPMTVSVADARTLIAAAAEAEVTLAAGHTFVYNTAVQMLADVAQSGQLGQLHYLDAARLNLGLYRHDVNVLWDLAAHDISIANLIVGDYPDSVSAWGLRHTSQFSEDVATLRMVFDRQQVEATVRASWLDPLKVRRTTVVGSEKMAVYNDIDPEERIKIFDRGREEQQNLTAVSADANKLAMTYRYGDIVVPFVDFREPLRRQANDFLECALTGRTPVSGGAEGMAVVAVLEASDRSLAENGAPVTVDLPGRSTQSPMAA